MRHSYAVEGILSLGLDPVFSRSFHILILEIYRTLKISPQCSKSVTEVEILDLQNYGCLKAESRVTAGTGLGKHSALRQNGQGLNLGAPRHLMQLQNTTQSRLFLIYQDQFFCMTAENLQRGMVYIKFVYFACNCHCAVNLSYSSSFVA